MFCQTANADPKGLNIGAPAKIPPGQESQFLQYQLQNNEAGLRQMRVIPGCVVGFGLRCNKTGTVLEQVIESNGGLTYQQMLIRAAGGEANYQRTLPFYGNNSNLVNSPYMSLWRNHSSQILDSAQYGLGGKLSQNPVPGFREVTKNFLWSGEPAGDLRSGFVNLKLSYGETLLREVAKIPNLNQQIRELNLEPDMTQFYLNNLSRGLNALQTGNKAELRQSILTILSRPYAPNLKDDGWYGRQLVQIPDGLVQPGETLTPNTFTDVATEPLQGEITTEIAEIPGEVGLLSKPGGFDGWLPWLLLGGFLIGLLLLLGGEDGDSSSRAGTQPNPGPSVTPNPGPSDTPNPGPSVTPTPDIPPQICPSGTIRVDNPGNSGGFECITPSTPAKVIEPSTLKAIILVTLIYCLIAYKRRRRHKLT